MMVSSEISPDFLEGSKRLKRQKKQFNISIAEVDDHDLWQMTTIGFACVSNHNNQVDEIINSVIATIDRDYPTIEIIEKEIEIFS